MTGATYWTLKDGTRYATGYWTEEFTAPYKALAEAGHQVVVATPNGVVANVDMMSLRPDMAGSAGIALELEGIIRSAEEMRRPIQISDARLDYDAVYFPGGHGPMEDLWADADTGRLLTAALTSGKPLTVVCHAPAAMRATRIHGVSPFAAYRVTAFTDAGDDAVGPPRQYGSCFQENAEARTHPVCAGSQDARSRVGPAPDITELGGQRRCAPINRTRMSSGRRVLPADIDWRPLPAFPQSARPTIKVGRPTEPAHGRETPTAIISVATSGCTRRQLPPVFGPHRPSSTGASPSGARGGPGPAPTASSARQFTFDT
ncbi:DJ-1/PfpI family protein [Streptomyces sp. NPDC056161]|uniref:DJ-1/PfpI family protein n=1 Tax=Streptomyces sp. NPDC056161 TaxID=3345732 RepID=UPI0035D55AD0